MRKGARSQPSAPFVPLVPNTSSWAHEKLLAPPAQQWPRLPMNALHYAAETGSSELTLPAVLARQMLNVNQAQMQGEPNATTPLMLAACFGYSRVVQILLSKGANVSAAAESGVTALHASAQSGHLAVTKLLVKAGAALEAKFGRGSTPLDLASHNGHSEVVRVLIEAGANPNSRRAVDGLTALHSAAQEGHVEAVKLLLRAKADPLLTYSSSSGTDFVPLDMAAHYGHLEVVRELIQQHGIEGCGGATDGVQTLQVAVNSQHVEVMGMLTSAGVVDTGIALIAAVKSGHESPVKFLLQHRTRNSGGEGAAYLDTFDSSGRTPLLWSVQACCPSSPRIARLLVDAGADTMTAVRLTDAEGRVVFDDTPRTFADWCLSGNTKGTNATESQLHSLEATRRLLMRIEAVHAISWLWASDSPSLTHAATKDKRRAKLTPTPLTLMLPTLRRRAGRPRVLLAALFRNSVKP